MDYSNKKKLQEIILFIFLALFPFGQLLKTTVHPIDLVAGLAFLYTIIFSVKKPRFFSVLGNFLIACFFSLLFSLSFFHTWQLVVGILYLIRLTFYIYFILFVYDYVRKSKVKKELVFNGLIAVSFFSAVFGWVQYFWFPDFRSFTVLGWDDHLYRLIGTFLDPGFTSIIIVFGTIAALYKYFSTKKRNLLYLILLFIVSLAFTYSRAGYISFIIGTLYIGLAEKKIKLLLLLFTVFVLTILVLPRTAGEGVKLERTASTYARLLNYSQTIKIFQKSPVFGIGFNNICQAKNTFFEIDDQQSHSCSGSDSSLLLILTTTGVVGFIIFLWCISSLYNLISSKSIYGKVLLSSSLALFIHGLFVNSLFYPWIMGWMAILLAVSMKESKE